MWQLSHSSILQQELSQLKQKHDKLNFPLPTVSTMDYPQQTAGSVTVCFLWWDWDGRRDAASSVQPAATFPWKLQTAGTYPVSVWPGCCLAHDLFHPHTHIHRHSMCAQTHTHCARLGGIYLCDELILTDCVDPASVTLSRPLWYPLYFTANQLSWKHTYM